MNIQTLLQKTLRYARRILLVLVGLVVVLALSGCVLYVLMQPPALAVPARGDLLIRDVTVLNPGRFAAPGERRLPARDVLIRDGRIAQIAPTGALDRKLEPEREASPAAARPPVTDISGTGRFLMPGLVDMHVHLPPATAIGNDRLFQLMFLAHGVTGIREMGATDDHVFAVRSAVQAGEYPGTRIYAAGRLLDGRGSIWPIARSVDGPEEAVQAVREQVAAGADFIKTYSMLDLATLRAIQAAADRAGKEVIGHIPFRVPFHDAGVRDVQHFEDVFQLAHVADRDAWMRASDRRWEAVAIDDFDYVTRVSVEQGLSHTPTLFNSRRRDLIFDRNAPRPSALAFLPAYYDEVVWGGGDRYAAQRHAARREPLRRRNAAKCELTRRLNAAGVRIHAGTDVLMPYVLPGESMHGEIRALAECGLSREDALGAATVAAGAFFKDDVGRVAVGQRADLLLLERDPTRDLAALGNAQRFAVIADGRLYPQKDLDRALERYRAHFRGALYDNVMLNVTRMIVGLYQ